MSAKQRLRTLLLCSTLGIGSLLGVPMRAEEIEKLMADLNRPVIAHVLREESESDDEK
jgi:hypothetical protein